MTGEYVARPPVAEDAPAIAATHVRVWREAYAGVMPQDYLDGMDVEKSVAKWRLIIADESAAATRKRSDPVVKVTRIAEHIATGDVIGFATFAPARDEDPPTPGELWAINILAAHHGSGVADQLMAATVGDRPAYLWVVEQNLRAQAFYRRHGFGVDGGTSVHEVTPTREIRMVRRSGSGAQ
ncbi:GNAT family N-acetyltransferase [Segeticoccus rhizosphaerae]|uniref:GNAT family N-acetyltransferase n=1 Tax=Segeticoccus rhizosphaerae TaxID=1104777 RepID=UPI001EF00841|nr:GNAT family N-acetyltransferase [Segeticoccus rhizosphaerae]